MKLKVDWLEGNNYSANFIMGNQKITSNMKDSGAMKPPELILSALATCGGLFLKPQFSKNNLKLEELSIETDAKKAKPPYMFERINMHYIVKSKITKSKLEEMIEIAEKKCIVKNTLNPKIKFSYSYEIIK